MGKKSKTKQKGEKTLAKEPDSSTLPEPDVTCQKGENGEAELEPECQCRNK